MNVYNMYIVYNMYVVYIHIRMSHTYIYIYFFLPLYIYMILFKKLKHSNPRTLYNSHENKVLRGKKETNERFRNQLGTLVKILCPLLSPSSISIKLAHE